MRAYELADERLVLEAMWLVGIDAQFLLAERFVVLEVAFKPTDLGVAFEGQHVGADPVEEPTIVGNHYGATREGEECIFQCAQSIYIEIIGRFVEE